MNELVKAKSPYLKQHSENPVFWREWNKTNLEEAEKIGKPLLISIGYASCHWCHVMAHESFENEKIAHIMNSHFTCFKVDREERPDVDQIYMTAANIITRSGGWPLNCFALPNGKPFHAGTYYRTDDWARLLEKVNEQYTSRNTELIAYAEKLSLGIKLQDTVITDNPEESLDKEALLDAVHEWKHSWDLQYGGIKGSPKFPLPSILHFLIHYNYLNPDETTTQFISISLDEMAKGGIHDHLAGGFARYSVDAIWKVPHFEKMLYDNAQLLSVYAIAGNQGSRYAHWICKKLFQWIQTEMKDSSGLYYSGIDADSEGVEGKFYTWTLEEIKAILGNEYSLAETLFKLNHEGYWEEDQFILLLKDNASIWENEDLVSKLLQSRNKRIRPGLDQKCLTSWNGLLLSGLAHLYQNTLDPIYLEAAESLANQLLKLQIYNDNVYHAYAEGESYLNGMLEDYAYLSMGLIDLFKVSGKAHYYTKAYSLAMLAHEKFYDPNSQLYYMNVSSDTIIRPADITDNVTPSSNAVMVRLMAIFGLLESKTTFLDISKHLLEKAQGNFKNYMAGYAYWGLSHLMFTETFYEIVIVGSEAENFSKKLWSHNLLNCFIVFSTDSSNLSFFKNRHKESKTLIYPCKMGSCDAPLESTEELLDYLKKS